jgi:Protein of unknown function (DUF3307)
MPLTFLTLLSVHFIADFVLQSSWMAKNKSTNAIALLYHATVYGACFLSWGWQFALVTAWLHAVVDAQTSPVTAYLWEKQKVHWFFVVIGLDQLIHAWILAYTFSVMVGVL